MDITDDVQVDPDTEAGMLAGLEQMRGTLFTGRWDLLTYNKLRPLAKRACLAVEGLDVYEVLLLGSYLAASARTQLDPTSPPAA